VVDSWQFSVERVEGRRKHLRLPDFDYARAGGYFVTICVKDKEQVLGNVVSEQTQLSSLGKVTQDVWNGLPKRYGNIKLDEFVIMPNHFHGIVWILGESSHMGSGGEGLRPSPTNANKPIGLPEIIRAFKSFSSREINKYRKTQGSQFWQRGYHEHILRNEDDLYQHRAYIQNNPLKWALDEYHL
jgi:REP element-mobilizing transposase RayT